MKKIFYITFFLCGSCLSKIKVATQRPLLDNMPTPTPIRTEFAATQKNEAPTTYVKRSKVMLKRVDRRLESGSLFDLDSDQTDLFSSYHYPKIGDYLTITTKFRLKNEDNKQDTKSKDSKDPNNSSKQEAKDTPKTEDIMASLPTLAPSDFSNMVILDKINMQVTHQFENGDLLLVFNRSSLGENDAHKVEIEARISKDKVLAKKEITTDDLVEVRMLDTIGKDLVEKKSSGWEDDYTLRLSGFNEAKSKIALELEEKKQKLISFRDQLKEKAVQLGKERTQMAAERDDLLKTNQKNAEEMDKMRTKLSEQQKEIDSLNPNKQATGGAGNAQAK